MKRFQLRCVCVMACVMASLLMTGCLAGELGVSNDGNNTDADDGLPKINIENNKSDMGSTDLGSMDMDPSDMTGESCGGVTCDVNAGCVQDICRCFGGYRGDGQTCTPLDSCENVTCEANSTCDKGSCKCDAGYVKINGVCEVEQQDACANVTCEANATCDQGTCKCDTGYVKVNGVCVAEQQDPCQNVTCTSGALCKSGNCECAPGFMGDGQTCTPVSPGDTALRSEQDVCNKWKQDRPNQSTTMWQVEPMTDCEQGVLAPEVQEDAIRRTSLFRWLVGLGPVSTKPNYLTITQACATTLAAHNTGLSHNIDTSYTCYTAEAKQGAGSSNLAMGRNHPADSVDMYVGDIGVRSLGHRRWVFNPGMSATGFGQRGRYSCMYSFDRGSQTPAPDYVAYPAPGFFPKAAVLGYWSFSSSKYRFDGSTTVAIKRVSDNQAVTVSDVYVPGGGYGQPALAWKVASNDVQTGQEYEVTIDNLTGSAGTTVVYRVTLSDCP